MFLDHTVSQDMTLFQFRPCPRPQKTCAYTHPVRHSPPRKLARQMSYANFWLHECRPNEPGRILVFLTFLRILSQASSIVRVGLNIHDVRAPHCPIIIYQNASQSDTHLSYCSTWTNKRIQSRMCSHGTSCTSLPRLYHFYLPYS